MEMEITCARITMRWTVAYYLAKYMQTGFSMASGGPFNEPHLLSTLMGDDFDSGDAIQRAAESPFAQSTIETHAQISRQARGNKRMHAKPPIPRVLKQCSSRRRGYPGRYLAGMYSMRLRLTGQLAIACRKLSNAAWGALMAGFLGKAFARRIAVSCLPQVIVLLAQT